MSGSDPTEIMVALHLDSRRRPSRAGLARWRERPRQVDRPQADRLTAQDRADHPGTNRDGQIVTLPIANLTIPEWLALKEGLI